MKKIGVILAEEKEIESIIKRLDKYRIYTKYNLEIYESKIGENICYFVRCGVGKVNAARVTQILISDFKVDYILNIGVAGSVSKDVNKCDIVIASKLVQHDFDVTAFNREKGFIPDTGKYFDCDNYLLDLTNDIYIDTNIHKGIVASGDIFVSDISMGKKIHDKFNALCVEMEGAAIAQVCYLSNIPFLVIRSISDSLYEENNNITFDEFLSISSDMVANYLIILLTKI